MKDSLRVSVVICLLTMAAMAQAQSIVAPPATPKRPATDEYHGVEAAFLSATAYGAFPTQTRNMWRGPDFFDSDLSINKNIKLTERFAFQIGTNLYNVFNHPNFINPVANLSNVSSTGIGEAGGNFGVITRTTAPPTTPYGSFFAGSPSGRIIQFQGKFIF